MSTITRAANKKRHISKSQKAFELRRFFDPDRHISADSGYNESLNNDGALSAFTETILWRLKGVHSMVTLIDDEEQYFISGVRCIYGLTEESEIETCSQWFGCSSAETPGGCASRFARLPVVNGTVAAYRFYAGAPITTANGINLGSLFIFDDKPRENLTIDQRRFLYNQASNVIRHLEAIREVTERRRASLMSKGIADFLDRASRVVDPALGIPDITRRTKQTEEHHFQNFTSESISQLSSHRPIEAQAIEVEDSKVDLDVAPHVIVPQQESIETSNTDVKDTKVKDTNSHESVLDKIRSTLDHAAEILRESLELSGGVVFLDPTSSLTLESASVNDDKISKHLSTGLARDSSSDYRPAKLQAVSVAAGASWDRMNRVDSKALQLLTESYPKGNLWHISEEGYFSPIEKPELQGLDAQSLLIKKQQQPPDHTAKQAKEAELLSNTFYGARQIIFLPLRDAAGDRWYSGCFVWTQAAVPVFTVESEIAYLSSFTSSVMVEINRLDAIIANKMKSDFISSISHEFRSPLHGILVSAEFMRDSKLDASQIEFITTIQNCSGTLLDTINHVLDYSKINSFDKGSGVNQQNTITNELYHDTHVGLLCEDIINGMVAANVFIETDGLRRSRSIIQQDSTDKKPSAASSVHLVLDIEHVDWQFKIQAGAFRRVIMNIFGNAQKYTNSGRIVVQLRLLPDGFSSTSGTIRQTISLRVRDTGRGMSSEYMQRKLYQPFAQEDSFATGVGLGLSIVWSIINQLGGKINIRSQIGRGTDVHITLPLERSDGTEEKHTQPGDLSRITEDAQMAISTLRNRAKGKSLMISRLTWTDAAQHDDSSWDCIEQYCSAWYGYKVIKEGDDERLVPNIVIIDGDSNTKVADIAITEGQRILVVNKYIDYPTSERLDKYRFPVGTVYSPIGPFKLARSILALLDQDIPVPEPTVVDAQTQTPLASPDEGSWGEEFKFSLPPEPTSNSISNILYESTNRASNTVGSDERIKLTIKNIGPLILQQPPMGRMMHNVERAQALNPPKSPVHPEVATDPLHILAVDDNTLNLQLIQRYLVKREKDTIVIARNGVEAVVAVQETREPFDIIFMDISMPKMDGFEATSQIRALEAAKSGRRAYIVALTGLASRRDRDRAENSGFDDFLTKPVVFGKIGEMLRRLGEGKRKRRQSDGSLD